MMEVYRIVNAVTGKTYVGITTRSIAIRWNGHKSESCHTDTPLARAIRKYGKDAFNVYWLDVASSLEELQQKEIYWIEALRTTNSTTGYNAKTGGDCGIPTVETRRKMGKKAKGRKRNPASTAKTAEWHRGRKRSAETCQRISDAKTGKPRTTPVWNEGKKLPKAMRQKISASLIGNQRSKGHKQSDEEKEIKRQKSKQLWQTPEYRNKVMKARGLL